MSKVMNHPKKREQMERKEQKDKSDQLVKFLGENYRELKYLKIDNLNSLRKIHRMFLENVIDENEAATPIEAYYCGLYWEAFGKNYAKMIACYKVAITDKPRSLARIESLFRLGLFWYPSRAAGNCSEHFKFAKEYFWSAFLEGHQLASAWLGDMMEEFCTQTQFKDYLKIALYGGSFYAMRRLALHYGIIEKHFDKMIYLYSKAIDNGDQQAVAYLKEFCQYPGMALATGNDLPLLDSDFNDTVIIIVMKYKHLFTRQEIINCLNSVFVNQQPIENKKIYHCLMQFDFTEEDVNCDLLKQMKNKVIQALKKCETIITEKRKTDNNLIDQQQLKKQKIA